VTEDEIRIQETRRSSGRPRARSEVFGADYSEEADYITSRINARGQVGEAQHGRTREWTIVDVPPGTERVHMDGAGGAAADVTWARYSGVRRAKFLPDGANAGALVLAEDREQERELEPAREREMLLEDARRRSQMEVKLHAASGAQADDIDVEIRDRHRRRGRHGDGRDEVVDVQVHERNRERPRIYVNGAEPIDERAALAREGVIVIDNEIRNRHHGHGRSRSHSHSRSRSRSRDVIDSRIEMRPVAPAPPPPPVRPRAAEETLEVQVTDRHGDHEIDVDIKERRHMSGALVPRQEMPPGGGMLVPRRRQEMWTEITKDLVVREAIEEVGYEFEETEFFFYIMTYLQYVSLSSLKSMPTFFLCFCMV
jgi:hypothetical protein